MSLTASGALPADSSEGNKAASGDANTDDETGSIQTGKSLAGLFRWRRRSHQARLKSALATDDLPRLLSKGVELVYTLSDVLKADGTAGTDGVNDTLTAKAGSTTVFVLTVKADGSWASTCRISSTTWWAAMTRTLPCRWRRKPRLFDRLLQAADRHRRRRRHGFGHHVGRLHHRGAGRHPGRGCDGNIFGERHRRGRRHVADGIWWSSGRQLGRHKAASGDANTDDETGSIQTGKSLAGLSRSGADETLKLGLKSALATDDLPRLLSKGVELVYTLSDVLKADGTAGTDGVNDTLTAKAGSTTVFVLTVKADGSWSFDLQDQLDHVVGGNDENFALQVAGGSPVSSIDFSKLLTGTDADGDRFRPPRRAPSPSRCRTTFRLFSQLTPRLLVRVPLPDCRLKFGWPRRTRERQLLARLRHS